MKDGQSANGKQRYRCRGCGRRSRENPYQGRPPEKEEQVLALLHERNSQRAVARTLKISRVSVAEIVKKRLNS